ncbi:YlbF family regulator [Phycisphaeraceae bacterium D3-23]
MASTEEILKQAAELGDLLAEHEASKSMESAVTALQNDPASQQALTELNQYAAGLEAKAAQGKPIEVADKRKMEELQQAVVLNPLMANFQRSQMAYVDLMRKIDDAITGRPADEAAGAAGPGAGPGPSPIVGPGM